MTIATASAAVATRATPYTTRAARWRAVRTRDPRAETRFVYAVRTTGIYCRPTCPSRRPLPANVEFFADADSAATAGYRACKRCSPAAPPASLQRAALITQLCRLIDSAEAMPTLEELGRIARLSRFHLLREFKAHVGLTPREFRARRRRDRVTQALGRPGRVTDAIHAAGYGSGGQFYAEADAVIGMSPKQFRAGGADSRIHYATAACSLGRVLVATTDRGLCAILLGDTEAALQKDLAARFPRASIGKAGASFSTELAAVVRHIDRPRQALALPLDIRGTAFQQRVWSALRDVAPGNTASYADIARRIDAPRAVRAVAQACAANPLAVAIPCHRVVRADGSLAGYRWGIDRKRELLRRESEE